MKKIIVITLIISILNLVGCYYQEHMRPSNYDFNDHSDIQIATSDTTYKLNGDNYFYRNDTLVAQLVKKLDDKANLRYEMKIPVEDIELLEVEKIDTEKTAITIGIITLVSFGIAFFFSLSQMNW